MFWPAHHYIVTTGWIYRTANNYNAYRQSRKALHVDGAAGKVAASRYAPRSSGRLPFSVVKHRVVELSRYALISLGKHQKRENVTRTNCAAVNPDIAWLVRLSPFVSSSSSRALLRSEQLQHIM